MKFGYPSSTHRKRARTSAGEFRHDLKLLRYHLDQGDCARAFSRITLLLRTEGSFTTDRLAVTGSTFPRAGGMRKQMERMTSRFKSMCIIRR